jgi:phage anti-repressor protein
MSKQINLQKYLETYSSINNIFIKDFFSLYNYDTTSSDFVINLDKIVKWLKSYRSTLKRTLVKSYTENIDYIVKLEKPGKGRPAETVLLTPDCFKRLCMLSRTKKAEEVRSYFIELEAHLDKYKNYIISGLTDKIAKYESELKPQPAPTTSGAIYVLKTTEDVDGIYKLGRTTNFASRLKVHQSSHPDKLEIMYVYETDNIEAIERCLKTLLKDKAYRNRREFYEIDMDILKQLIKNCDCSTRLVKNKTSVLKSNDCRYILHVSKDADTKSEKIIRNATLKLNKTTNKTTSKTSKSKSN